MSERLERFVWGIAGLYGLAGCIAWAMIHSPWAGVSIVQMVGVFYPWLAFGAPLLGFWALVRRRWVAGGILGLASLGVLAGLWGGAGAAAAPQAGSVRVMSWNLHISTFYHQPVKALVAAERPDIIALQEVGEGIEAELVQAWASEYPYYVEGPQDVPVHRLALFSRHPIVAAEVRHPAPKCRYQRVDLEIDGKRARVINVHFYVPQFVYGGVGGVKVPVGLNTNLQNACTAALVAEGEIAREEGIGLLVMGDLNTTPQQPNYDHLRSEYGDAFAAAGWGMHFTYPAWQPLIKIDHILHNAGWEAEGARVLEGGVSDHRPISAELRLR